MSVSKNKFQKNINGLRAFAVVSVVLFHFQLFNVTSGFVGVDIFFVISGYLMTKILANSQNENVFSELRGFYVSRLRRITPVLSFITLIVIALFATKLLNFDFDKLLRRVIASNLFFSNYSYYIGQGDYFKSDAVNNPLLHTWSLSLEWQFYVFYPIGFLIAKNLFKSLGINLFLLVIFAGSLLFSLTSTYSNSSYAYYSLESRAWEFIAGGCVAMLHLKSSDYLNKPLPIVFQFILFIGLILSILCIDESNFPGWQAVIPVVFTAAVIYDRSDSVLNSFLSIKPIQFIGDISYSLYLWHWVVFSYISIVIVVDRSLDFNEKLIGIFASFLLAYITYQYVERHTRNKNGFWSTGRIVILWLISISISILSLAFILKNNNVNSRLPDYMQRIEQGIKDKNPDLNACMSSHEESIARGFVPKFCKFGAKDNKNVSVILWGDSHADAIQPAINFVLKERNLTGFASTASGCAPFDGIGYSGEALKQSFSHCGLGHGKKTIELIQTTDSIKYVMMHANWARYDFKILKAELVPQVCEIKKTGKKIIMIGQVPIPNFDVPRVWASRQLKIGHALDEISFDESISDSVNDSFKSLVRDIEKTCGEVQVIYPSQGLCESGKCFAVKNGKLNYIDTGHLSANGSTNVQEIILKKLPVK